MTSFLRLLISVGLVLGQHLPLRQIRNRKFINRFLDSSYDTSPIQFLLFIPGIWGQVARVRARLN